MTQKPISTISYNSKSFLLSKLSEWYDNHIIQSYMFIEHKGEDGDKDHIHLRLEPNKRLDPMDLREELFEYVPGNKLPLACRPFRPSVEEDWILYVVHDPEYLRIKYGGGEKGEKIPYSWENIEHDPNLDTEIGFIRAKAKLQHSTASLSKRLYQGEHAIDLLMEGEDVFRVNAIKKALNDNVYELLVDENNKLNYAIEAAGFTISVLENGGYELVPVKKSL